MFSFRPALRQDYSDICALISNKQELFLVYPNGGYPFTELQLNDIANERKLLTVAIVDGHVAGFANLYNYQAKESAFMGNVVIDKRYRGKGGGKQLIEYMLDTAFKKCDLLQVRISVFAHNTPALLLYTGLGFTPYDIDVRRDPDNKSVALIHMRLNKEDWVGL